MTDLLFLHTPRWQPDGDEWHLMVGNRSVAQLILQIPAHCGQ